MTSTRSASHLALILLLLCTPWAAAQKPHSSPTPAASPKLVCPNPIWDFGKQPQFKRMHHDYVIRNEGTAVLRILDVQPSCQCQAAMPLKRELQPGEQTIIKASFDSKTMSGPIHKPITVKTNDPARPRMQLLVRGKVLPPYWFQPAELNLGSISKKAGSQPQTFSIFIAPQADVDIRTVEATSPFVIFKRLTREPLKLKDGGHEIRYQVNLKPGLPVGVVRERLIVTTDVSQKRTTTLGINAEITGEVKLSPRTFRLGRIKRGTSSSRTLDIHKSGAADLAIEEVTIKPKAAASMFHVVLETVQPGRHFRVQVSVNADAPAGYHRGRVVILTNCPGERVHQAYFYVSIRP